MSVVQHKRETTRVGGVTGAGFMPGQSGNPGGRPKGLSRRVRELVGDNGEVVAEYMASVLSDETERTADRMEAAKWLADRGFGKAALVVDVSPVTEHLLQEFVRGLATEDLEAMEAILQKYVPDAPQLAESSDLRSSASVVGASSRQR